MCWKFKHTKSCWDFVHAWASAGTQTGAFTSTLHLFSKRTVPLRVLKARKGRRRGVQHCHRQAMFLCSSLRDNQHWYQSQFSCRSCPVPPLICGSITPTAALHFGLQPPLGCKPRPPLPLHCPRDSAISHRQRTVSAEPRMKRGNFKRALQLAWEYWNCSAELLTSQPCSRPESLLLTCLPTPSEFAGWF